MIQHRPTPLSVRSLAVCAFAGLVLSMPFASAEPATVIVATADSSEKSKASADFVGDGMGDQEEIYRAIHALPEAGGTVCLMEGTYDIRKVDGKRGGIIIDRSNVTLAGQGAATRLIQAPEQNTNVIRIIGLSVGNITIRDLYVDANRDQNPYDVGDPNVSHDRFEYCGIKAFRCEPGGPSGPDTHDITIQNCHVMNAKRLGIMLEGPNMKVIDSVLGNAFSDSVEILTGPGQIRGNYVEITGKTHVAIGTDRGNNILMTNNIVHIKETGDLDIGFRSWASSLRHVVANNVLTVDQGGKCTLAMDIRGDGATVTGNCIQSWNTETPIRLAIGGGDTVISDNLLENVIIEVNDKTALNKPIMIRGNIMDNSTIEHVRGNLIAPDVEE
ncbi:MAG TPA: right-handed parallel beta-helix repeat-containing protein [bacterium]|nr:right-handed parallel beta-helix repeat-containing protein [bacterium]HQO33881.1 right-handed parallel beta-helix repeat-containing protein [bacterium]HQP99673.1 right-handed parallel beta-helix repeat-containing protein [bacterium]